MICICLNAWLRIYSPKEVSMVKYAVDIKIGQLEHFLQTVRKNLYEFGIDVDAFDEAVLITTNELNASHTKQTIFTVTEGTSDPSSDGECRGIDCLGRILVEYCFFLIPETQLIWPENSEPDLNARKTFTPDAIPRPLMRYFLASVRGSIPLLDNFAATSILSDDNNEKHGKRMAYLTALLDEFKGPFGSGESAIDWDAVYSDRRFQQIALELIGDLRLKTEQLGHENYARLLENFRHQDSDRTGVNAMQRAFTSKDTKQIDKALAAAKEALAQAVY